MQDEPAMKPHGPQLRRGRALVRDVRSRGQALVEFTLVLPVFMLMTVGVVDMARIYSSQIALTDGVREAALFAANGQQNLKWCSATGAIVCPAGASGHQFPDPDNIAYQIQFDGVQLDPTQVTMQAPVCTPAPCTSSSTVTVSVTYRVAILTPVLSNVLGGHLTLSATTTAQVIP